ncbi:MAG: hypothetical protein LBI41_05490 [Lactobacillales bacterium]|jgi:hypothetical protein|nr:hypothetical protein [Lactobacillales bacterium]
MESALIDLVVNRVIEEYVDEAEFYQNQLGLPKEEWDAWKKNQFVLPEFANQQLIFLFSDYEWMLVQKVIRLTKMIPEKEQQAVLEYRKMSAAIAKKWINSDLANIEIVEKMYNKKELEKYIQVKVVMDYNVWGYSDIISFTFPAVDRTRVASSKRELIQLMTDTYE